MMNSKTIIALLGMAVLANVAVVGSVIADTQRVEETHRIEAGAVLEIRNRNGRIRLEGWDGDQLMVRAIKQARWGGNLDQVKIHIQPGKRFSIETIYLESNPKVSVSFDVRVPNAMTVERVVTSNGKIILTRTHGDTTIESSNGKIEVDDVIGNIRASTSNGAIAIKQVKGVVSAETSNGAIDVEGVDGVVALETSNGAIDAEVPAIGDRGLRVRTNNGKIKLYLAPALHADIEVQTSNSDIELDGIEVIATEISTNRLRGRIGEGGPIISCKTSNGAIILGRLQ